MEKRAERCGNCQFWHFRPPDAEERADNALLDGKYQRECTKANVGAGAHLVASDPGDLVYTGATVPR